MAGLTVAAKKAIQVILDQMDLDAARDALKALKPIEINDLEAQIVHLWTAEEDLEIRPLFNGHLIELQGAGTNNAIEADVVE